MKRNKSKLFVLTGLSVLMIGLFLSCQNAAERAAEKIIEKSIEHAEGEEVDINIRDGSAVIETEEGRVEVSTDVKGWPGEIPSVVPKFKEGEVLSLTTNSSDEGEGWTMVFSDVPANAAEKYNKALKSAGFTTQTVMINDEGGSVTAEKENVFVYLMAGDGSASLSVQIQAE